MISSPFVLTFPIKSTILSPAALTFFNFRIMTAFKCFYRFDEFKIQSQFAQTSNAYLKERRVKILLTLLNI